MATTQKTKGKDKPLKESQDSVRNLLTQKQIFPPDPPLSPLLALLLNVLCFAHSHKPPQISRITCVSLVSPFVSEKLFGFQRGSFQRRKQEFISG